jgi:hypothetical protein
MEEDGSTGDVGDSFIGVDPTIIGNPLNFGSGKFGTRWERHVGSPAMYQHYPRFDNFNPNLNRMVVECWITLPSTIVKTDCPMFEMSNSASLNSSTRAWAYINTGGATGYISMLLYVGGVEKVNTAVHMGSGFTAGVPSHFIIVLDTSASSGVRARAWRDGVELSYFVNSDSAWNISGGTYYCHATTVNNNAYASVMSNLKVYSGVGAEIVPDIIANKDNEYWPVTQKPVFIFA